MQQIVKGILKLQFFKRYLGQKPTDMTVEEWVKELDNLPCMICGGNTEDDDELLMLCDLCNKGILYFFKIKASIHFV